MWVGSKATTEWLAERDRASRTGRHKGHERTSAAYDSWLTTEGDSGGSTFAHADDQRNVTLRPKVELEDDQGGFQILVKMRS